MKINVKLFLLTFSIISFVSISSAIIYHSLTIELLSNQQSKSLVNSANDFIFVFQKYVESLDEEFYNKKIIENESDLSKTNIDFIFNVDKDSVIQNFQANINKKVKIYSEVKTLSEFLSFNSNLIIRKKMIDDEVFYYGKYLSNEIIKDISHKIRADIAISEELVIGLYTITDDHEDYLPLLSRIARELKDKNNFELVSYDLNSADVFATHFSPKNSFSSVSDLDFIIFTISNEGRNFSYTMNIVTIIIVISGIFLTIVFLLLFTIKFRKQLSLINEGVKLISQGNLNERVKIISEDEIGILGKALNNMLNEIEKRDKIEKDYSEFISLINKNTSLKEIGDTTLNKIVEITGVDIGGFYLCKNEELIPISLIGISEKKKNVISDSDFYRRVKEKKEKIEIHFENNKPIIKTGLAELKVNHLYILPLIYGDNVIAILELAAVNETKDDIVKYFERIKDQLAIGLANAISFTELQKLVEELKKLNDAYQQQNLQIKEQNEQLLKLHDQLKKGSEELEIQRAKAVESANLKSQFLANMSHELRTPQNAILGLTELLLKDPTTNSKTKERLNVVLRNGKKLLNLIENILEFSKLESGNTQIIKSNIYLSDFVHEIKSFVEPLFIERELEFKVEVSTDYDYTLCTDIKKVEQIVFNLIGNASKFTQSGFVLLNINIQDQNLEIVVEDTGPGISDKDKKIIFEEFRQADGNLNRQFNGSGLGLAICKRYTELLGGEIKVFSELEKGSKFVVSLPGSVLSANSKNFVIEFKNQKSQKENFKALIISEGKNSIKLISDYLISNNINVNAANIEEFSVVQLQETPPNIIILDVLLNSRNGWKILFDIKNNPNTKNIPIVVINMDEEANCGFGLAIKEYYTDNLVKISIMQAIENFETQEGLKFRKILFIINDEKFIILENEFLHDDIKIYHYSDYLKSIDKINNIEIDLIIIDLFDISIDTFKILSVIQNNHQNLNIPVIAFLNHLNDDNIKIISNQMFEITLINQYHPLDVLKIIRQRIDLIDSSIFRNDKISQLITEEEIIEKPGIANDISINYNSEQKIKILIVDDDKDARFTIGEIIENLGYEPQFATNGYECLEKLKTITPHLILLDIMMPQMDGFETIKRIRKDSKFNNLKVFALTAYAMLSDKEIIEKNGFDGLFTKPINSLQLEKKLKNIFSLVN